LAFDEQRGDNGRRPEIFGRLGKEVLKTHIIPLWNAYSFFTTYASSMVGTRRPACSSNGKSAGPLDLVICEALVREVTKLGPERRPNGVFCPLTFLDSLNNWYIRRSRRRFWRSEAMRQGLGVRHPIQSVDEMIHIAAPVIPSPRAIYRNHKTR
jgi:isoleucyl-tRNA synthetase